MQYITIKEHKSPNGNLREVGFEYTRSAKKDKWTHKHIDFLLANGFIEEVKEPKLKGVPAKGDEGDYILTSSTSFNSKVDAYHCTDRIEAEAFLMRKAVECGARGFVVNGDNYSVSYNYEECLVTPCLHTCRQDAPDWAYFPTPEAAEKFKNTEGVLENYSIWLNMK